jgi:hypothetical protein
MLVSLDKDPKKEVNLYSIDTGNGGNIFQPHYFDMNRNHLDGKLKSMVIGAGIEEVAHQTLMLVPESQRKDKETKDDL